jgi:TatD DNase family protein
MEYLNFHTHHAPPNSNILAIQSVYFDEKKRLILKNNDPQNLGWAENSSFRIAEKSVKVPRFSVGIHPWHLPLDVENALRWLRFEASQEDVLAVGEAGLDRAIAADFQTQTDIFIACARLAEELEKPLILHCVRANEEILMLKKLLKPSQPWIVHGFSGHPNTAKSLISNGLYLSFGHGIFKNEKSAESLAAIPADRFFLETDAQTGIFIEDIYAAAAQIRGWNLVKMREQIWANFIAVFGRFAADF